MTNPLEMPRPGWLPPIKYVQVQTHTRCSANCVFCPFVESDFAQTNSRMTDETWNRILEQLATFDDGINGGKFCPYLMQEPLIDKTIFDKIKDVYRAFPGTCVEVSTNGTALTDKVVDKLFAAFDDRRHDLWVSHHGIDEATYKHIMDLDYSKGLANLINLLKQSDGRITIKIRGAGESRDGKHVFFRRQQYLDYWANLFAEHNINTRNVSVDAFTFHDRAGTLWRTERDANTLNMGKIREIGPDRPFHCPRIDEWLHFMWDGSIRICCMDYHGEVKLSNVNEVSLVDYFRGVSYYQLVGHVSGRIKPEENFICNRCVSPGG